MLLLNDCCAEKQPVSVLSIHCVVYNSTSKVMKVYKKKNPELKLLLLAVYYDFSHISNSSLSDVEWPVVMEIALLVIMP